MRLTVRLLTAERWPHRGAFFQAKGCSIARGCWCMYYRGAMSMYRKAGFVEVARRRPERPVVRLSLSRRAAPACRGR